MPKVTHPVKWLSLVSTWVILILESGLSSSLQYMPPLVGEGPGSWRTCLTQSLCPKPWALWPGSLERNPLCLLLCLLAHTSMGTAFTCPLVFLPRSFVCPYESSLVSLQILISIFSCLYRILLSRPSCPATRRLWDSRAAIFPSSLMGQSFQARSYLLIWAWNLETSLKSGVENLLPVGGPAWTWGE